MARWNSNIVGIFQNGIHGVGEITFTNGDVYNGSFLDGMLHFEGILTTANGTTYEGEWKRGEKWGEFLITDKNGVQTTKFYHGDTTKSRKTAGGKKRKGRKTKKRQK